MDAEGQVGRLWHGGAPGRRVGDWLQPPDETGLEYTRKDMSEEEGFGHITQRRDRVYVTTDRALAKAWAASWTIDGVHHGGGALYRVDVEDDLEVDEDLPLLPGLSFQVRRAKVIAVIDAHVPWHPKHSRHFHRILKDHAAAERQSGLSGPSTA